MAAKKNRVYTETSRKKISASKLIGRLMEHIDGKISLEMSQVRAIDILLKKIIPDLTRMEMRAEVTHNFVIEVPATLTREQWLERYKVPALPPPNPVPNKINGGTLQ
jgi:hypothetical protein